MLCFLDTSALVKRYRREIGTEVLERLFEDSSNVFVMSAFSLVEFARVLDRHRQIGELSEGDVHLAMERLAKDSHSQRVGLIDIQRTHLAQAKDLIFSFHLSAPDALILATALTLAEQTPVFVLRRHALRASAGRRGLPSVHPESA